MSHIKSLVILLFFITTTTSASILFDVQPIPPNAAIQSLAQQPQPIVAIDTPCIDVNFLYCQHRFNDFLGLNTSWTWRQAMEIANAINDIVTVDVNGVLQVCRVRTLLGQCLGSAYGTCVNRLYLVDKDRGNIPAAFEYVRLMTQLNFICNGGFEEVVNRWGCIVSVNFTTPGVQACIDAFSQTLQNNPERYCEAANNLMTCYQPIYAQACDSMSAGWFICEDVRMSFADDCPGLRCRVQP